MSGSARDRGWRPVLWPDKCRSCFGSGRDRRKRRRPCLPCDGSGWSDLANVPLQVGASVLDGPLISYDRADLGVSPTVIAEYAPNPYRVGRIV